MLISSLLRFLIISAAVFIFGENAGSVTELASLLKRRCPHFLYWENILPLEICDTFWCSYVRPKIVPKQCYRAFLDALWSESLSTHTGTSSYYHTYKVTNKVCSAISKCWLERNKLWKKHISFSGCKVETQIIEFTHKDWDQDRNYTCKPES